MASAGHGSKNLKKVKIQDIGEQLDETYDRSKKLELVTA